MSERRRRRNKALRRGGDAYLIATVLPAAVMIGYGIGWGITRLFDTGRWPIVVFTLLGVAAGFMEAIRIALRVGREEDASIGGGRSDGPE